MPSDKFPPKQEDINLNFLDRNLVINLEHNPKAVENYPDITPQDFETKRERYRILLGKVSPVKDSRVSVSVDAIMKLEPGDMPIELEIQEGSKEIRNINLRAIRNLFEHMKSQHPELEGLDFIGDMHTHPVMPHEYENDFKSWQPSQNDLDDIVRNYKNGTLDKNKPFIFSIAGPDESGKTQYAFYRLIFEDNKYKVESL